MFSVRFRCFVSGFHCRMYLDISECQAGINMPLTVGIGGSALVFFCIWQIQTCKTASRYKTVCKLHEKDSKTFTARYIYKYINMIQYDICKIRCFLMQIFPPCTTTKTLHIALRHHDDTGRWFFDPKLAT